MIMDDFVLVLEIVQLILSFWILVEVSALVRIIKKGESK